MTLSYVSRAMCRTKLIYALEGFRDARRDNLGLCLFVPFKAVQTRSQNEYLLVLNLL